MPYPRPDLFFKWAFFCPNLFLESIFLPKSSHISGGPASLMESQSSPRQSFQTHTTDRHGYFLISLINDLKSRLKIVNEFACNFRVIDNSPKNMKSIFSCNECGTCIIDIKFQLPLSSTYSLLTKSSK
ncbi:hypothetical protein V6Z11_D08G254100 [Gossypium hirsutum]